MAAPDTRDIRAFPFLTVDEFHRACHFFLDKIQGVESLDDLGWSSIRFVEVLIQSIHDFYKAYLA